MRYLVRHKKEFTITIVALVVAIFDFMKVFGVDLPVTQDGIYAVVSAIVGGLCWFYNMPTSIEGEISKVEIKQRKACRNVGYFPAPEPEDAEIKE